jgi:hypothetical protein
MEAKKENTMTLEDFQKKLFWIGLYTTTPIVAIFMYVYL